jgi:hypothetical protein
MSELIIFLIVALVVAFFTMGAFNIHPVVGIIVILICAGFWFTVLGAFGFLG